MARQERKLIFAPASENSQQGEFTLNRLDAGELAIVRAFVNWDNPLEQLLNDSGKAEFQEIYGRSITVKSPTREVLAIQDTLKGEYRGLQIMGACGSLQAVQDGLIPHDTVYKIDPVDSKNHTKTLARVTASKTINDKGKINFTQKQYVPLHGMTQMEANRRKQMTARLRSWSQAEQLPFVTPELAAEGFFTNRFDNGQNPLAFQVYRVPLLPRFATDFNRELANDPNIANAQLAVFASLAGKTLRLLHEGNLAYVDGHLGNMSLIVDKNERKLYITDLGSMKDLKDHPYPKRYKGYDVFTFFYSLDEMLKASSKWLRTSGVQQDIIRDMIGTFGVNATNFFVDGYYANELALMRQTNQLKAMIPAFQKSKALEISNIKFSDPQRFIEAFETNN